MNQHVICGMESPVKELGPILEVLERMLMSKLPDAKMRELYRAVRELKMNRQLNDDEFENLYSLLNDLSDALKRPDFIRECASNVILSIQKLSSEAGPRLINLVHEIEKETPSKFFQPYQALYSWTRDVFSDPSIYSSHLLQSRDESIFKVSQSERESALYRTFDLMHSIRLSAVELNGEAHNQIVNLTLTIEGLLRDA